MSIIKNRNNTLGVNKNDITILRKSDLIFYLPNINRNFFTVNSLGNRIYFNFFKDKKLEIYDKRSFRLLYQTHDPEIYGFLVKYPFLLNVSIGDSYNIHIYYNSEISYQNNFFLPYAIPERAYIYQYSLSIEKDESISCFFNSKLSNTTFKINLEIDYEEFFKRFNPLFLRNKQMTKAIKKYYNEKTIDNLDYGFDIVQDAIRIIGKGGQYKNILICWFNFPNPAKRPQEWIQGRIIAIDTVTEKIIWEFDLELISSKQPSDLKYKKIFIENDLVKKNYSGMFSPRTYTGTDFFYKDIYVFTHNYELYGMKIKTGEILWRFSNTSELPLPYKDKGYFVNLRGTYRVIDLQTGEELIRNEDWVKNKLSWFRQKYFHRSHIKFYDEYIVIYEPRDGVFYFHERTTGSYLFKIHIQEQFWSCAAALKIINKAESERKKEDQASMCPTNYWDVYANRLYIMFFDVFCVYDLRRSQYFIN